MGVAGHKGSRAPTEPPMAITLDWSPELSDKKMQTAEDTTHAGWRICWNWTEASPHWWLATLHRTGKCYQGSWGRKPRNLFFSNLELYMLQCQLVKLTGAMVTWWLRGWPYLLILITVFFIWSESWSTGGTSFLVLNTWLGAKKRGHGTGAESA